MTTRRSTTAARVALTASVALGVLHAGLSLLWLLGSTWLLDTVREPSSRGARGADLRAIRWHAAFWDPWFALWGAASVVALWLSRTPRRAPTRRARGARR